MTSNSQLTTELDALKEECHQLKDQLVDIEDKYCTALKSLDKMRMQTDRNIKLQRIIAGLFNSQHYSDLVISMEGGQQLWGHKLVLLRCGDDWGMEDLHEIPGLNLQDTKYEIAFAMIKWVYTDEIKLHAQESFLIELLQVASRFKLEALQIRCEELLSDLSCGINDQEKREAYFNSVDFPQMSRPEETEKSKLDLDSLGGHQSQAIINCDVQFTMSYRNAHPPSNKLKSKTSKNSPKLIKSQKTTKITRKRTDVDLMKFISDIDDRNPSRKSTEISSKSKRKLTKLKQSALSPDFKCHSCEICGKIFLNNNNLINHLRTHSGEKPFKCDVCHKAFSEKGNLQKHMYIHTGEKPFTCEICGTSFNTSRSLQRHCLIHMGEKPYKCDICDKSFNTSSYVEIHKRTHTGEKPYTCDVCGKSFTESCNLQAHIRIHSGEKNYQCDICGKAFTQSTYVKIHKRIHSGERPYTCTHCQKRFRTSSALQTHVKVHTGEKPFKCDVCGKMFRESSMLRKHLKTHM